MQISDLIKESYETAKDKGWHEKRRETPELLMLMITELAEAMEDYRKGFLPNTIYYEDDGKPCGFVVEIADTLIRIFDMCGYMSLDIENALRIKMDFNKKRAYRHGGKIA